MGSVDKTCTDKPYRFRIVTMKNLSDLLDAYDPFECGILDSKIYQRNENGTKCDENASISDDEFLKENGQYQILLRKVEEIKQLKTVKTSLQKQSTKTAKKDEIANTKSKIAKTSPKTNHPKMKSKDTPKNDSPTSPIEKEPDH